MNRWVKTANGQSFADSIGVQTAPMTIAECVSGCLAQVRNPMCPGNYFEVLYACEAGTGRPSQVVGDG